MPILVVKLEKLVGRSVVCLYCAHLGHLQLQMCDITFCAVLLQHFFCEIVTLIFVWR